MKADRKETHKDTFGKDVKILKLLTEKRVGMNCEFSVLFGSRDAERETEFSEGWARATTRLEKNRRRELTPLCAGFIPKLKRGENENEHGGENMTLDDYPEYTRRRRTFEALQSEGQTIATRIGQIEAKLMTPRPKYDEVSDPWTLALKGEGNVPVEIDANAALKEELQLLEGRQRFIAQALEIGGVELDRTHGQASREICGSYRPQFVRLIGQLLEGLRKICAINDELEKLRRDVENTGVRSDSIPPCLYDAGGPWDSEYGSRITAFRKYITENFPELTDPAGWSAKAKLTALNPREGVVEEGAAQ